MSASHGVAAERRVRQVAAILGVPEFVYMPPVIKKGSGVREVGDGILLCGAGGAIIQVKARARRAGLEDSPEEAQRWVFKHAAKAVSQGRGSKRTIERLLHDGTPLDASPMRQMMLSPGQEPPRLRLDIDCSSWPTIVVLAHPRQPQVVLPWHDDVFYISSSDWRALNQRLRSVNDLMRYIQFVLEAGAPGSIPLARERERFESLTAFHKVHSRFHPMAVPAVSSAAAEDPTAINAYRELIEGTSAENDDTTGFIATDYREILDYLDDLPAAGQVMVGRVIMRWQNQVRQLRRRVSGVHLLNDRPLVYMCDLDSNQPDKSSWLADLFALTTLRQCEWRERTKVDRPVLGVGLRVSDGGLQEYSYVIIREGSELPAEWRRHWEWRFGTSNFGSFQNRKVKVGRNEKCPCGSGKKFKRCHAVSSTP